MTGLSFQRRLPLRLRLTLIFVVAMAIVLVTVGAFLYFETKANLDAGIDAGLRLRAHALAGAVAAGAPTGALQKQDPLFEILDERGRSLASSPSAPQELNLGSTERRRALRGRYWAYRGEELRLLAQRVSPTSVVIVGSPLRQREHALEGLATALTIGGPLALLLAALAAYGLATRAFASIEVMRARAAEISRAAPVGRLPLDTAPLEIRELGETLNGMLDRIAASAEHERRFVADASHQLRTPLAVLTTELEVAQRDANSANDLRAAIASALEEANRLTRLADSLLILAQADEQELITPTSIVPISPLLKRIAAKFDARARSEGRELEVEGADVLVHADPLYLEQAIVNLVDNAFTHGDGRVTLAVVPADAFVRIRVRDQGRGFVEPFLSRAFDRFSRAPDVIHSGGSGLGLSIVAEIAAAHGGQATITETDKGAEVVISLPVRNAPLRCDVFAVDSAQRPLT